MIMSNNLYVCKNINLLIFETKDLAVSAWLRDAEAFHKLPNSDFWEKILGGKIIGFISPNDVIMLLKKEDHYWHVISGEKVGWIVASNSWVEVLNEV